MPPVSEEELNHALTTQYDTLDDEPGDEDFGDDLQAQAEDTSSADSSAQAAADEDTQTGEDDTVATLSKDGQAEVEGDDPSQSDVEAQSKDEASEEDDAGEPKKPIMIPKRRLDSVIARAKRAEAELEALRKTQSEQGDKEKVDWDARMEEANKKFSDALADGDTEAAALANKELMQIQRDQLKEEISSTSTDTLNVSRDAALTDEIVDEVIMNNAEFQVESDKFDQQLVNDIEELRGLYESQGASKSQALIRALELRAPNALEAKPETRTTPKPRTTNIERNIAAAENQAPDTRNVAEDSDKYGMQDSIPDIYKLTDDELDALPESTWDRLLGNDF